MSDVGSVLGERRTLTNERVQHLRKRLESPDVEASLGEHSCIYATGSVGRGESSSHSDLDLFIVSQVGTAQPDAVANSKCVVDRLAEVAKELGYPPFSKEGEYLKAHPLNDLIGHLGTREDDHTNVFTARMLLLLESRAVIHEPIYNRAIEAVVKTYWRDYAGNEKNFIPVFLTNDITRYWKVLCLSYEAHGDDSPEERRLRNYKLKHSRLLTCYSAILYLAWVLRARETVTPEDATAMTGLSPTERLEFIGRDPVFVPQARRLLEMYAKFLETVDAPKADLLIRFADSTYHATRRTEARAFGGAVFQLLIQLAEPTELLRFLLV
ncbi:MAG TPA: DUF294 nucleotidyltransferase-like domain-containing protein [Thermoanaerobaculia bacterium]|jgi:predicted nucleotidyltransferase